MNKVTIFLLVALCLGVCTSHRTKRGFSMSIWGIMNTFNKFKEAYEEHDYLEMMDMGLAAAELMPGMSPNMVLGIKVARANIGVMHPAVKKMTSVMLTVKDDLEQFSCPALLAQDQQSHIARM